MAERPLLLELAELPEAAEALFGGKAAGLKLLIEAGARVPPGFAIAPDARPLDPQATSALRERVDALLVGGPLAVRSSALGEDGAARSFAGLFESELGLGDRDAVLAAAARCRASGSSERVRAYTGGRDVAVGLVFQRQIAARAAGVCFTRDPTGRDAALVLEAVSGTGERLMSGQAAPERWRVYRNGWGRLEAQREAGTERVLSETDVLALAEEARRLAGRFGRELDLEWARDAEALWWLQARPITVAPAPPRTSVSRAFEGVDDGPVSVWSNWNVRETLPDALAPLTWTLWRDAVLPAAGEPLFGVRGDSPMWRQLCPVDCVEGRAYWNMNALLSLPLGRLLSSGLRFIDHEAHEVCLRLVREGVLRPRRLPGSRLGLALGMLLSSARSALGLLPGLRPERALRDLQQLAEALRRRPAPDGLSDEELLREATLIRLPAAAAMQNGQRALGLAMLFYLLGQHVFRRHPEARALLAAGIAGPTTSIGLDLDALVEAAQPFRALFEAEPLEPEALLREVAAHPAGPAWLARWQAFLDLHGQRCAGEFDLARPRWREQPAFLLGLVRAGLVNPGPGTRQRLADVAARRHAALRAALAGSWLPRRILMRWVARRVERHMPLREAPKHHGMEAFARMRLAVLELASRLVARGQLAHADDIFLWEWPELQAVVRGAGSPPEAATVAHRREELARLGRLDPPHFVRSDGVPVLASAPAAGEAGLRGVGVSGGIGRGRVRQIDEPDAGRLQAGEVLVVRYADPGWTPLFPRAAALVMEVGGAMCHAAIVARELGIPAVFGVPGAREHLPDGLLVQVDGALGRITLLSPDTPPQASPPRP